MGALDALERYRHSGKIPPLGAALALVGSLSAGAILGWLYTDFICAIPWVYLNFIATIVFGYAVGAIASRLVRLGKIRAMDVPVALALTAAAVGLYVAWARDAVVRGLLEDPSFELSPGYLWAYVKLFNAQGGWALSSDGPPLTGAILWGVWLCETCLIFAGAWLGSQDALEDAIFCEPCERWTVPQRGVKQMTLDAWHTLEQPIKAGEIEALADIKVVDPGSKNFVRVDLSSCAACAESNYVKVVSVSVSRDGKGVERASERVILPPVRISGRAVLRLGSAAPAWVAAGLEPAAPAERERLRDAEAPDEGSRGRRKKNKRPARDREAPDEGSHRGGDAIRLRCPHCGKKSRIPPQYAGRRGRCPKCKEQVQVPDA